MIFRIDTRNQFDSFAAKFRKFLIGLTISFSVLSATGCGTQSVSATPTPVVKLATSDVPTVGKQNGQSLIDCDNGTYPVVIDRQEMADHLFVLQSCNGIDGAIEIEAFLLEGTELVSDGLISGPDALVTYTGPCVSTETEIACPVKVADESGKNTSDSRLVIAAQDEGFSWSLAD